MLHSMLPFFSLFFSTALHRWSSSYSGCSPFFFHGVSPPFSICRCVCLFQLQFPFSLNVHFTVSIPPSVSISLRQWHPLSSPSVSPFLSFHFYFQGSHLSLIGCSHVSRVLRRRTLRRPCSWLPSSVVLLLAYPCLSFFFYLREPFYFLPKWRPGLNLTHGPTSRAIYC